MPDTKSAWQSILCDARSVQAGAWLAGFFQANPGSALVWPLAREGIQNPLSDVPIPSWPYADDVASSAGIAPFVAAGLLNCDGADRFRLTTSGERVLPYLPLFHLRNVEGLPSRFPRLASAVRGRRVLDAGCGVGTYSFLLAELGAACVHALDYGDERLGVLREFADSLDVRLACVRGSIERLPLSDGSVDFIFCRVVLPLVHQDRAISEFARVLAPNGQLLLMLHAPGYYRRMIGRIGLSRERLESVAFGVLGLLSGAVFDVVGCQPRWRGRRRRFYLTYARRGSFERLLIRHGLILDDWEAGAAKPYVWGHKPDEAGGAVFR